MCISFLSFAFHPRILVNFSIERKVPLGCNCMADEARWSHAVSRIEIKLLSPLSIPIVKLYTVLPSQRSFLEVGFRSLKERQDYDDSIAVTSGKVHLFCFCRHQCLSSLTTCVYVYPLFLSPTKVKQKWIFVQFRFIFTFFLTIFIPTIYMIYVD